VVDTKKFALSIYTWFERLVVFVLLVLLMITVAWGTTLLAT